MGNNKLALFIPVIFENDLIYYQFTHYIYHTRAPCVVRPFNKRYKHNNSENLSHCLCVCVCLH